MNWVNFYCKKKKKRVQDRLGLPASWVDSPRLYTRANILQFIPAFNASKAQMNVLLWRTFIVFLLKSQITKKQHECQFLCSILSAHSSFLTGWTTSCGRERKHFWLPTCGHCALGSMWSHCCQSTKPEAFLPQGHTMAWNSTVVLH